MILLIYWILTTIYGVYWLVKHPSDRRCEDENEFTLLEVVAKTVPAAFMEIPVPNDPVVDADGVFKEASNDQFVKALFALYT